MAGGRTATKREGIAGEGALINGKRIAGEETDIKENE